MFQSFIKKIIQNRTERNETGNSLVVTVLMFPLLFGVFGLSLDLSVAVYTQNTLQSSLDTAAQSALSRALNPGEIGNVTLAPTLTYEAAQEYFRTFYDVNRSNVNDNSNPFLKCQTTVYENGDFVNPASGCGYTEKFFDFNIVDDKLTIDARIYETSHAIFIPIFGVTELKYHLETSARTTFELR